MIKIAIAGAAGRMGKTLIQACDLDANVELVAALEHPGSSVIGVDAGELAAIGHKAIKVVDDLTAVTKNIDVLIDFTRPEATLHHLAICQARNIKMVIGTTGLTENDKAQLSKAAQHIPIVFAPNMSIGVNLSFKLLELAAKVLGEDMDIEILEAHHRHKVDAPSGTALGMGEAVAKALGWDLTTQAIYARQGQTGARPAKTIGFQSIRAGDIIGEHTVMFATEGERLEISHKATSRMNFARGALRAAKWLATQNKGLFDMQDALGLK